MTRGPKSGAGRDGQHEANARKAWGDTPPTWVLVLAQACDRAGSLAKIGARIDRSAAAISQVINAKYPGDLAAMERTVRAVLLAEQVACPVLGLIAATACLDQQRAPFSTASPATVRLGRACRSCAHNAKGGGHV